MTETVAQEERIPRNFITDIIDADLKDGKFDHVATRFPPEPNGYLHMGHAKSICLNYGLARDLGIWVWDGVYAAIRWGGGGEEWAQGGMFRG